ncbi:MAG: hypothetical protein GY820_16995 [Gammaproteobacteria bacterium]|nr:hypothetical protein [Gammaproteobacteria bacterium]
MKDRKKEQINGIWYWVSDHYPTEPYDKIIIGTSESRLPNTMITAKKLFERFPPVKREALIASTDATVEQFVFWLGLPGDIDREDPIIVTGFTMLVQKGILSAGEAAGIIAVP